MSNNDVAIDIPADENNIDAPEKKSGGFGAGCKEFFRRRIVSLKRKPQNIALIIVIITGIYNLLTLSSYSQLVNMVNSVEWIGLLTFINTLFSILAMVAFIYSFPKIKKDRSKVTKTIHNGVCKLNVNIPMYVVLFVMLVGMLAAELGFYFILHSSCYVELGATALPEEYLGYVLVSDATQVKEFNLVSKLSIAHDILLGVDIIFAALVIPFSKLLMHIDTSIKLESALENTESLDLAETE